MSWLTRKLFLFGQVIDHFHAHRRGERRIAPYGATGRVYERVNQSIAGGNHQSSGRGKATLDLTITRANGTVERRSVPVTVTRK